MEREAFRLRMQLYKLARELNPLLKYWDWKKYADGGTISDNEPERPITNFNPKGNPYTPLYGYNPGAGYTRSVFDLYDAPVIGDALSIYDTGEALYNKDWLGAGLSAAAMLPFVPRTATYVAKSAKKVARPYIPTVTRSAEDKINALLRKEKELGKPVTEGGLRRVPYEDAVNARNRVYESFREPENIKRARAVDSKYGTDYESTYKQLSDMYEDSYQYYNSLYEPEYNISKLNPENTAWVTSDINDKTINFGDAINNGEAKASLDLVRHEIGHKVDAQATRGAMNTNPFMRDLSKDIVPFESARFLFENTKDPLKAYQYLTKPSEIKSHMNQFRQYLIDNKIMKPSDKVEDVPNFFMHLLAAPDEFKNVKVLKNLFKSDRSFKKKFDMIPLTNINNKEIIA